MWACICGVWGETEAERPSQAKDNSVCVWGGGGGGVGGGGAGRDVSVCVWAETEAERHTSQPGKGQRCVCVCVCVRVRAHARTYVSGVGRRSVCLWGRGGVWRSLWPVRPCEECVAGGGGGGGGRCVVWVCGV